MNLLPLLLTLLTLITHASYGQDGTLDSSFGGGAGYITTTIGTNNFSCYATAIQTDGKIVCTGSDNHIIRLNSDGTLDTSFGTAETGIVATALNSILALIIQPDGSIVACGGDSTPNGVLTRYTSSGILDTNFGNNGVATAPALSGAPVYSAVLQADNKIIVGARSTSNNNSIVARFNSNGTPDITFATVTTGIVAGLVVQTNGQIVALIGTYKIVPAASPIHLVRYNTNGSVDYTFGYNGVATGPTVAATGLAIQPDGKFLVGGFNNINHTFQVTRFDAQGNLDTSFNGTGFNDAVSAINCQAILLQANGAIVLVGTSPDSSESWYLARYTNAGALDSSFGNNGIAEGPLAFASCFSIALQADGKLIIGGDDPSAGAGAVFVARYLSSPAVTTTQINPPNASIPLSVNSSIALSGQAQDPSLVFLLVDSVLQQQGTHTDPNNWSITTAVTTIGTHVAQAVSLYQDGNLNIASDPVTFVTGPHAPISFTGTVTKNEFLNKTECVLQAAFTQSPSPQTAQYIVAQNGVTIAVIPATQLTIPSVPSFKGNNVLNKANTTTIANMGFSFVLCGDCKANAFNGITVSAATASGIVGAPQPLVITQSV